LELLKISLVLLRSVSQNQLLERTKSDYCTEHKKEKVKHTQGNCLSQANLPPLQHYRIHFEGPFAKPVAFVVALLHFSVIFPATQLLCRCLRKK